VVNGATHNNDAVAHQAQADLTNAYNVAAGQATTADLSNTDLGNRTLTAGTYKYTLVRAAHRSAHARRPEQPRRPIRLPDRLAADHGLGQLGRAAQRGVPCNVYWQIGSSAVLGSTTAFQGNVMALTSISLNNGATVIGRLLARNGAVTLINNVINGAQCGASTSEGGDTLGPATPPRVAVRRPGPGRPAQRSSCRGDVHRARRVGRVRRRPAPPGSAPRSAAA
jgi:hypothetical protein